MYSYYGNQKDYIIREEHIIGHPESLSKEKVKIIIEQMDNSVCKIIKEKSTGTGFICIIPYPDKLHPLPVLITCNHILGNKEIEFGKSILLLFDGKKKIIQIDKSRKIFTSDENRYDITMIELKPEDNFNQNHLLEIDYNIFEKKDFNNLYKNQSIYIIHFPMGKEVNYSLDTIKNISQDGNTIAHLCSSKAIFDSLL